MTGIGTDTKTHNTWPMECGWHYFCDPYEFKRIEKKADAEVCQLEETYELAMKALADNHELVCKREPSTDSVLCRLRDQMRARKLKLAEEKLDDELCAAITKARAELTQRKWLKEWLAKQKVEWTVDEKLATERVAKLEAKRMAELMANRAAKMAATLAATRVAKMAAEEAARLAEDDDWVMC
jgi:ribosomal protein L12E/L44/L45/RPP1/RPP2